LNDNLAPVSVVDLISAHRATAIDLLLGAIHSHDYSPRRKVDFAGLFPSTLSVLCGMPDELADNVAMPIFKRFFDDYELSREVYEDVVRAAQLDDVIATGIRTAVQAVLQQYQEQQRAKEISRQKLLQGRL
jgi:hypothetical protein